MVDCVQVNRNLWIEPVGIWGHAVGMGRSLCFCTGVDHNQWIPRAFRSRSLARCFSDAPKMCWWWRKGKGAGLQKALNSPSCASSLYVRASVSSWTAEASSQIYLSIYSFIYLFPSENDQHSEHVYFLGYQSRRQSGEWLWIKLAEVETSSVIQLFSVVWVFTGRLTDKTIST